MALLVYGSIFSFAALATWAAYPFASSRADAFVGRRSREGKVALEDMFIDMPVQRVAVLYGMTPLVLGALILAFVGHPAGLVVGIVVGLVAPPFVIRQVKKVRLVQFHSKLVDSLLLMSSCLRAGLSMMQSFQVITEEMRPPVNQEFGLMLKEVRMGVTLDEALIHMRTRMPSDDMNLFVTAVLVARETGGDVTGVFTRLVETLRERKKIKEKIKTMTFMARMQGIAMAILPVVFVLFTYSVEPAHFNFFLKDPMGQTLLGGVITAQVVSAFLFIRFSRSPL